MKYDQLCLRFTFAEFSTNVMCKVIVFFNNTSLEIYLSSFGIRFEQLCEQIILKAILIKVSMKVIPVNTPSNRDRLAQLGRLAQLTQM